MKARLVRGVLTFAVFYIALLLFIYLRQDELLFITQKYDSTPASISMAGFDEVEFKTKDGETIYGWYASAPEGAKTIVYFGGNAERLTGTAYLLKKLQLAGFGVLGVQYRGYGKSSGTPSEQGLFADAEASIDFLKNKIGEKSIVVMGRSLGTGVAVHAAYTYSLGGLVLWSPYTSIEEVAQHIYWYLPVKALNLARHKFDSMSKIANVEEPLLMIYGGVDGTIPPEFSMKLYNASKAQKQVVLYPDSNHNNFDTDKIIADVVEFLRR